MQIQFSKMHGLGNDFMVIDGVTQDIELTREQVRAWGDRHFGVGFDQLLLVEPPETPDVAFRYRVFNADGEEVEQCGNGARCFATFVRRKGLTSDRTIRVQTSGGVIELQVLEDGNVRVDMGVPRLAPADVPFQTLRQSTVYDLALPTGQVRTLSAVSMGNPHAVLMVNELSDEEVSTVGPILESHEAFPERANVGFLKIENPRYGRLRVYERGVGETLACGSGACAALVAAQIQGRMDKQVTLALNGGEIHLEWAGEGEPVYMTGPATFVFDGEINWEDA